MRLASFDLRMKESHYPHIMNGQCLNGAVNHYTGVGQRRDGAPQGGTRPKITNQVGFRLHVRINYSWLIWLTPVECILVLFVGGQMDFFRGILHCFWILGLLDIFFCLIDSVIVSHCFVSISWISERLYLDIKKNFLLLIFIDLLYMILLQQLSLFGKHKKRGNFTYSPL